MIISIRVDERLIHGQVALVWTKEFNTTHVVVANDQAASDKIQQMTLKMATPTGVKLLIKSVKDSERIFNDPRAAEMRMFVLTDNVKDALEIVRNCEVGSVNVANIGRITNPKPGEVRTRLNSSLFADEQELEAIKDLINEDVPSYHQILPSNHKISMESLLKDI
ncbi:PTS system mannose/fructose/N-acetylgalactosamine-transporter subunit IIB [Companilactobacillus muriivasis]|uniref:PTS system mannose/fructose/N-acetylgalactosamine-transporter subunit IIB n=1 Tax=Companilactobacillus muriivasis TaxID=3081444 RepID=UPI0030C66C7E